MSTTLLAVPAHLSAWVVLSSCWPHPTWTPSLTALIAEPSQKPPGCKSTILEALSRQSRAWNQPGGFFPGAYPAPACSPSPMPKPLVHVYTAECRSTATYRTLAAAPLRPPPSLIVLSPPTLPVPLALPACDSATSPPQAATTRIAPADAVARNAALRSTPHSHKRPCC